MVIVMSGAVILEQSDHRMTYKRKCEACGTVQASAVHGLSPGKNVTQTDGFHCDKCGNHQKIVFQGGK